VREFENMEIKRAAYAQGFGATGEWISRELRVESKLEKTTLRRWR
jgi:hypothetical protein